MEADDSLFEDAPQVREADRLTLDIDGWEGPLDLLLTLARSQKVDLTKISILALVEQYLAFIADAKKLKLEIAADYLVMAAWLAYLKSCLLLPRDADAREVAGKQCPIRFRDFPQRCQTAPRPGPHSPRLPRPPAPRQGSRSFPFRHGRPRRLNRAHP